MKTYGQFIREWIDETQHQIDSLELRLSLEGVFDTDLVQRAQLHNQLGNERQLMDDLCDILFRATGRTYLDHIQGEEDERLMAQGEDYRDGADADYIAELGRGLK